MKNELVHRFQDAKDQMHQVIVWQDELIDSLLLAVISKGHVLVEWVPGLAKTLAIETLAQVTDLHAARVQFTPDLLPSDLTGAQIYDQKSGDFVTKHGPIFANFVLADEINRAPSKVQSALLEAMAERHVTIGDHSYDLPTPFIVMATQNPLEQEGTYNLPEAQLDRFLMHVTLDYPTSDEEMLIMQRMTTWEVPTVEPVLSSDDILQSQQLAREVTVTQPLYQYVWDLIAMTRTPNDPQLKMMIQVGLSPRASIGLITLAKAKAFMESKTYVTPDDIKAVAHRVMRHRLILSYEALSQWIIPDQCVDRLLDLVPVMNVKE